MKKSIRKFLQFNGRTIYFLHADGQYWIAIRPLCEALNVSYTWQLRLLKKHRLYRDVYANQTMHDSQNRLQKMVALPEKRIYFWLSQLPIKTDEQYDFVVQCSDLLHDYFHGTITGRQELLMTKADIQIQKEAVLVELKEIKQFMRYQQLLKEETETTKALKAQDQDVVNQQLSLFES